MAKGIKFPFPPFKNAIFAKTPPFRIYPGAMIPVDDMLDAVSFATNVDDAYCKTFRVLPPGIPLDLDLVDVILQHLQLLKDFTEQFENETATIEALDNVTQHFANNLEQVYMEVLWRRLNHKKP